jgi:hypothetical protein
MMYRPLVAQFGLPNTMFAHQYTFNFSAMTQPVHKNQSMHNDDYDLNSTDLSNFFNSLATNDLDAFISSTFSGRHPTNTTGTGAYNVAGAVHHFSPVQTLPPAWQAYIPSENTPFLTSHTPASSKASLSIEEVIDIVIYIVSLIKDGLVLIAHINRT